MDFNICQVGKRWFKVEILKPIEGSLSYHIVGEVEDDYSVNYWDESLKWTLTGTGARKYRNELIAALNKKVEQLIPVDTEPDTASAPLS